MKAEETHITLTERDKGQQNRKALLTTTAKERQRWLICLLPKTLEDQEFEWNEGRQEATAQVDKYR
jgi:hypothetical protein